MIVGPQSVSFGDDFDNVRARRVKRVFEDNLSAFSGTQVQMLRSTIAGLALLGWLLAATNAASEQCVAERLEQFLEERAFELSAEEKIDLYADRLVRYYDKYDISRPAVLRSMKAWVLSASRTAVVATIRMCSSRSMPYSRRTFR